MGGSPCAGLRSHQGAIKTFSKVCGTPLDTPMSKYGLLKLLQYWCTYHEISWPIFLT